ncbi:actin-binding protein IPP-like [Ornithodoros turicata]
MAFSVRPRGPGSQHRFPRNSCSGGGGASQHRAHPLFRRRDHGSKLLSNLNDLREKGKFCDVELVLDSKTFSSHKAVLAASCPYFEAMFSSGLSEVNQKSVEIRGVNPSIFEQLLSFIYKGEIHITQENCQDLLSPANMLGLSDVVQACCDYLQRELHPSNCVGIFRFAELHSCTNLKLEAKRFIERRFTEVILEDEFYDLPKDTIKNFLKSEGLSIDSEFQVFEATTKWILRNVRERRKLVFELLEAIRFPVISQKQLDLYMEKCPDEGLKDDLLKVLSDLKLDSKIPPDSRTNQILDVRQQPRMCTRKCIYLLGGCHRHMGMRFGEGYSLASADKLDLFRNSWSSLAPMAHTRSGPGTAVLNNLIYVVGGESDCLILASGEVLDPVVNQWASIADMVQPRCMMGLCALDGFLYAVGGWVGAELGDTVEKYDPVSDTWRLLVKGRMTSGRYAMGVLGHQGLIYVIGGYNDHMELNLVECFNPVTHEWTTLAPLRTKRAYVGVGVLHDHIYAVGGSNDRNTALATVERYSIEENKWTEILPLSLGRAGASVVAANGSIYVMGGRTSSGDLGPPLTLESVEEYHPEMNVWTQACSMPLSRCYAGVTVI